jgi:hypothetical protein
LKTSAGFNKVLLERTINAGIGPSALRNQGSKNVVGRARAYLNTVDYRAFSTMDQETFKKTLDNHTESLRKRLPAGAKNWGAARKALNLVLRDILYNQYLQREYGFNRIGKWLELPLDS